jgi:hypothetical protein
LAEKLNNIGYNVNYKIIAMPGNNDEYFIYVKLDGNKQIVFSNNSDHASQGAYVSNQITESNVDNIVDRIKLLVK